jgi:hypothetical protein
MTGRQSQDPDDKRSRPRRAVLTGGAVGLAAVAGSTLGGRAQPALAQSGTASITDWINVTQTPYNADNTGTNDATAAINKALSDAGRASLYPNGAVVYLPVGTYLTSAPLTVPHGVTLRGATPLNQSADGQTQDWGSVLKPSASGTIKTWTNGTNVNGVISIDGTSATLSRMAVEDIWIDGSSLTTFSPTPTVDGIAGTGAVEALTIRGVGIYLVTGNGIAAYSPSTAAPDGWLIEDSVVQGENTSTGITYTQYGVTFDCSDSYFSNVHVQQCNYGFSLTGGNNRLIGCRADSSKIGSGFTFDVRQNGKYFGSSQLVGCGTESNNHYGLSLVNTGAPPNSRMNDLVIATACSFDGDGANGGSGGGNYAGISVAGINMLILNACNVTVTKTQVTNGAPQYALAIASNAQGPPMLVQAVGGFWDCANPNSATPKLSDIVYGSTVAQVLSVAVHGTGGGIPAAGATVNTYLSNAL